MANVKITELTDIGTPASNDVLEIVDISTNTSKKVQVSALGGGATPTLQEVTTAGNTTTNSIYSTQDIATLDVANENGVGFRDDYAGINFIKNAKIVTFLSDNIVTNYGIQIPNKIEESVETLAMLSDITGGATDLAYTPSPTNGIVTSSTGTDATLPLADGTNAGLLKPADFTQLSTLATDLASKQDDLTASNVHTFVDGLTAMTTPVDADRMIIVDNSASLAKKITWANIKATLKTYFDTLYATTAQVDLRTRELLQDFTDYTTTGVLTEQIISNQAITANDMKINSWLNFISTFSRTGTTQATVAIYLNTTSNSLVGAVKIGTATISSTQSLPCFKRDFSINASSVLRGLNFTANAPTDEISTNTQSTTTLTLSSGYYLISTVTLNNVADTVTQRAINLKSSK